MKKSFLSLKKRAQELHDEVVFLSNTYINTYTNLQTHPGDQTTTNSYNGTENSHED